ncbi:hypothetical protein GCM10009575_099450 [Streptomyces rhizosphaericus]|uniref:Uncharacterized protein n=2 Tax=Streptomycetaceae TaxID=2062 RepID=A0ABP4CCE9_9ACTN
MTRKWNNEFYVRIGLIPAYWYFYHKIYGFTLESYIQRMNQTQQAKQKRTIARAKETGQEYFTPDRLRKMNASQRLVTD